MTWLSEILGEAALQLALFVGLLIGIRWLTDVYGRRKARRRRR